MTVQALIEILSVLPKESQVLILHSTCGGIEHLRNVEPFVTADGSTVALATDKRVKIFRRAAGE